MGWWDDKLQEAIGAVTRGVALTKLGPGVLGTITPINTVGVLAVAVVAYALSSHALFALIAIGLALAFLVYANERAYRYAEKNPIPALLSGTEMAQLFRDQMGASDKSIIVEAEPVIGGSVTTVKKNGGADA